jgi:hypothetical protein
MRRAQPLSESNSECAAPVGAEARVAAQHIKTNCQRLRSARIPVAPGSALRLIVEVATICEVGLLPRTHS